MLLYNFVKLLNALLKVHGTNVDVYAYSVYGKINGKWKILKHETNDHYPADHSEVIDLRFKIAKDVAVNILRHYVKSEKGTVSDFCQLNTQKYDKNLFKLCRFYKYLKESGSAVLADKVKAYAYSD